MAKPGWHFNSPSEVADAFFEREDEQLGKFGRGLVRVAPSEKEYLPQLTETMFFASMVTEEGRLNPVGIVFSDQVDSFQQDRPAWDLVRFAKPERFDVASIARLSAVCEWPSSFLVAMPVEEALAIVGIATPQSRGFFDRDDLIRVLVPKPGVVAVCRGGREVVRYERGTISTRIPFPAAGLHRPQLDSIGRAIMGEFVEAAKFDARRLVLRVVREMVALGHGGLLAIMAPDEHPGLVPVEAKRIEPPLKWGDAISEMYDAELTVQSNDERRGYGAERDMRPETAEEAQASAWAMDTNQRVSRFVRQIARLTAVDGAVVMSHQLNVLAFGAKLPGPKDAQLKVFTVSSEGELDEPWNLSSRGTRHHAAAAFANGHPMRLSVIVSQDGHAATFQQLQSKLVYWPLGITVAVQEPW